MKKLYLLLIFLTTLASSATANECPIIYKCTAHVEDVQFDSKYKNLESNGTGTSKNLKTAIERAFKNSTYGIFCEIQKNLPLNPKMDAKWESYDPDEKFHVADCSYICEEDSI